MIFELEYIKDIGWLLKTDIQDIFCSKCLSKIEDTQFFACAEKFRFFHRDCELKTKERICTSQKIEHIHYNIIESRRPSIISKMLAMLW